MLPFTAAVSLLAVWLAGSFARWLRPLRGFVQAFSRHSLGIYVLHPLALIAVGRWTGGLPVFVRVPLLVGAALAFGCAATAVLARSKLGAMAIGERQRTAPARLPYQERGPFRELPEPLAW